MIDHESILFSAIATKLREEYGNENIYIIGEELSNDPPKFPAVSIVMTSSIVNDKFSTFNKIENVAIELYKVEAVSNDTDFGKEECKKIINIVDEIFESNNYIRTFNEPVASVNSNISRRVARYKNNNSIGGN